MIKNIRIFAADIDGTLLTKGGQMMPKTREALQRLHREGVLIGPASGRPLDQSTLDKAKEWELGFEFDFAIGMNGGDLWTKETGEIEHFCQLQPEEIRQVLDFIWDMDINAICYQRAYEHIRAKRMDFFMQDSQKRNHSKVEIVDKESLSENPTGKIEVHMSSALENEMWERVHANQSPAWIAVKTFDLFDHVTIEFMSPDIHKGLALEKYAERMNVPIEEVIAFGDMQNDIGLLKSAGWGVCLENGADETKAVAQAVTEHPVTEDGVGRYLEEHWFNR